MKKFISKISFFFALPVALYLTLITLGPETFHHSIYDKHKLLQETVYEKRVVLVGGSNVMMGVCSPKIEEELNLIVINTAIAGGYGLKYILDDVLPYLTKDDVVIIIPEYENFYNDFFYRGSMSLLRSLETYPKNIKKLNLKQLILVLNDVPNSFTDKLLFCEKSMFGTFKKNIYLRSSFNENGDFVAHWGKENKSNLALTKIDSNYVYNQTTIEYVQQFKNSLPKGVELYLSYPSFSKSSYLKAEKQIEKVSKVFEKSKIPILGSTVRYCFNDSLFFDTRYHLNYNGQVLRTQYLIQDLKSRLTTKPKLH